MYDWTEDRRVLSDRIEEEDGYVFSWDSVVYASGAEKMGTLSVEVYNSGLSFAYLREFHTYSGEEELCFAHQLSTPRGVIRQVQVVPYAQIDAMATKEMLRVFNPENQ